MRTPWSRVRTFAFAVILALGAAPAVSASGPAPTRSQAEYEIRFMTEMIDHHAMAVMMAEMCVSKAVHDELRALCEDIIATQQQEIATMQTWLQTWYNVTHAPEMPRGMQEHMDRMAEMSGAEFEIEFMKMMIRHHWKAVVRASGCIDRAYHPELIAMCADIVEAQVAEIQQLRTWLCDWYSVCNYGPKGNVTQEVA